MGKSPKDTGGPIVKTGPTSGKNRSRNKDGKWRKKRSDSGKSKKSGGCFLTTAACQYKGMPDNCHELEVLRNFRDKYLLSNETGQSMIEHYYAIAPRITKCLDRKSDLNNIWSVVTECVDAIESDQYQHAVDTYKLMVEDLEKRFLK